MKEKLDVSGCHTFEYMHIKKEKQKDELIFNKVTSESIQEMILEYKNTGFVPIVIELTEENDVEMLVTINSMHSGGSAWVNGFDVEGKFVRINEGFIKKINHMETTSAHFEEYNKYVEQAEVFHKQNREFEEQFGLFNEGTKGKYPYDRDVQ